MPTQDLEYLQTEQNYSLLSELFNFETLKLQEQFAVKRNKSWLYFGCLENNLRSGLGVLIYKNGRIYEGEWKDD